MIDRIISFITYFPANLRFSMGEYEFSGLCLRPGKDFPWSNRKERNQFLDELSSSEEADDLDRFVYWSDQWLLERIHQRFSLRFLLLVKCYTWGVFCLLAFFAGSNTGLLTGASFVIFVLLLKYLTNRRISNLYFRMNMIRMAVDILKESKSG